MIVRLMLWLIAGFMVACISVGYRDGSLVDRGNVLRQYLLILTVALGALSMGGCTTLRPDGFGSELSHNSGLLVDGRASDGTLREDSLDVWNNYVYWQRGTWYAEAGMGLKVREGGFYLDGPPVVFNGRVGRRFSFGER